MRTLLSTTALALALGLPSLTLAQTTAPASDTATQTQTMDVPGFLAARHQSDVLASELIGHDVYARPTSADMASTQGQAGTTADGDDAMATMNRTDLDDMENIGQINEIVLSDDGQVRAIVIGVGGFLGVGEQDVAVTMDQVTFASDAEDPSQMHIVVNIGADMLEESPAYDRTAMADGESTDKTAQAETDSTAKADDVSTDKTAESETDRTALTRPEITREGFDRVEATRVSTEMLVGASVYDVDDNSVGTVDKLIVDDDGTITNVIIDFGGFLGIGSSQASLGYEELTILSDDRNTEVRIYVDATKEQIQSLPQYQAME